MNVKTNPDGSVQYEWVKMAVSSKNANYYNDSPGYQLLGKSDANNLYAFRRAIFTDEPIPHHLDRCTEYEITKLERKVNVR